jgi:flagellar basal-body rod modification protein FlgD
MSVNSVSTDYPTPSADTISSREASLGQADFLKMLVAQMTVQDPMNPQEGTEFASQLAQFSQVQELQKMSTTLDNSYQTNLVLAQSINNTMASSFIGKSVRAEMDQFSIGSNDTSQLYYNLSSAATTIQVDIKDSDGNLVRTLNVSPQAAGDHTLQWDGMNSSGVHVPAGKYTYAITATGADDSAVTATAIFTGVVTSVSYATGSATLMSGDVELQLSQVLTIGNASDLKTKGSSV